jgi:hypothetical protein
MARGRLIGWLLGALLASPAGAIAACSTNVASSPLGKGDTVIVDPEPDAGAPEAQPDADEADSPYAPVDGSEIFGSGYGDASGYEVLTICEPADASAEASTPKETDASAEASTEASTSRETDAAAPDAGSYSLNAGLDAGCQPLPPACASQPASACECILATLAAVIPCVPSCRVDKGFHVYCPP